MQTLYHDDDDQVDVVSSVSQNTGMLSVDDGAKRRIITSDRINYIDCDEVNTDEVMVDIDNKGGFLYPYGHAVVAKKLISGEGGEPTDIAYHDDDNQVNVRPGTAENAGMLRVDTGGEKALLESDKIDYISCGKVASERAAVDVDSESGFVFPDGHVVTAEKVIQGTEAESTDTVYHSDADSVREYSSIDQFDSYISAVEAGASVPIEFDEIDYIDCGKVVSHPVIVDSGNSIGYLFSDGFHEVVTDEYPMFDSSRVELRELPAEMGDGFYEAYVDEHVIANFDDNEALGLRSNNLLRIGQHYYLADDILPASDVD